MQLSHALAASSSFLPLAEYHGSNVPRKESIMNSRSIVALASLGIASVLVGPAMGHGDDHAGPESNKPAKAEQKAFGVAGDPGKVSRTIDIDMTDEMRFFPSRIDIERGETIRFRVTNKGRTRHEMVLGTLRGLQQHAALMRQSPDMDHGEPYSVHVEPGATEEIVWTFNRSGAFSYGCLIAGHFEAGMVGKAVVNQRG